MPNSSKVIRTAPLAEALAHFVLRVDVVCAMRTVSMSFLYFPPVFVMFSFTVFPLVVRRQNAVKSLFWGQSFKVFYFPFASFFFFPKKCKFTNFQRRLEPNVTAALSKKCKFTDFQRRLGAKSDCGIRQKVQFDTFSTTA